ncbi:MAG: MmcQ/YjbR family DNA-binding protein [Proteiniphilum sp.]
MNIEELFDYCLAIEGAEASTPFNETTIVLKVMGKMFAMIPTDADRICITLKCNPEKAVKLREDYDCVESAFHMNKTHWNTLYLDGDMPENEIKKWINHSVEEVMMKLPKNLRQQYYGSIK